MEGFRYPAGDAGKGIGVAVQSDGLADGIPERHCPRAMVSFAIIALYIFSYRDCMACLSVIHLPTETKVSICFMEVLTFEPWMARPLPMVALGRAAFRSLRPLPQPLPS
ncbi:MAG: hypothetical protein IJS75_07720 [Bacteroidales bacterium]|nr:hypothetical protein [Bacteroidales bacterium]